MGALHQALNLSAAFSGLRGVLMSHLRGASGFWRGATDAAELRPTNAFIVRSTVPGAAFLAAGAERRGWHKKQPK
jgi:hypothetical protein